MEGKPEEDTAAGGDQGHGKAPEDTKKNVEDSSRKLEQQYQIEQRYLRNILPEEVSPTKLF